MINTSATAREFITELLSRADREGFAVPAFNYSDIWDFLAIVEAAEELRAPVFVSSNERVFTDIGIELCGAFAKAAAGKCTIPHVHHLDHCTKPGICKEAVDNAYSSVMIDASMHPLETNIRFVEETEVDSLSVGIGTTHRFYKGKPVVGETPTLWM